LPAERALGAHFGVIDSINQFIDPIKSLGAEDSAIGTQTLAPLKKDMQQLCEDPIPGPNLTEANDRDILTAERCAIN